MDCENCGEKMERGWGFCPKCGFKLSRFLGPFGDIFSKVRKEMEGMNRLFEKDIEAMDISPFFKPRGKVIRINAPMGSGFSIKIVQSTGREPQVSVKTFGNVRKEDLERQIQQQLGVKPAVRQEAPAEVKAEGSKIKIPAITEEPKTHIKRSDGRVLVDIEMPGVKSERDIEIREFESSVEVKAVAGEKAYFKILSKPGNVSLSEKGFEKGILHLEFY